MLLAYSGIVGQLIRPLGPSGGQFFGALSPLVVWVSAGVVLNRWLPELAVRRLGRFLYWVAIPLEIYALSRHSRFSWEMGIAPAASVMGVVLGGGVLGSGVGLLRWWRSRSAPGDAPDLGSQETGDWWTRPATVGSALLSAMLGNTGFVGLALMPSLIPPALMAVPVFYNLTQTILGTYGIGVLVAGTLGDRGTGGDHPWWSPLARVVTVPSLWAFALGIVTQSWAMAPWVDRGLDRWVTWTIALAFVLMGLRLSQLRDWTLLKPAIAPVAVKVLVMPLLMGGLTTAVGLSGPLRLALVLMAGMPTAFAGLILAEEYNLNRPMVAASIALSTVAIVATVPLWLWLYG